MRSAVGSGGPEVLLREGAVNFFVAQAQFHPQNKFHTYLESAHPRERDIREEDLDVFMDFVRWAEPIRNRVLIESDFYC